MRTFIYLFRRNISLFLNNKLNILLSFATIPIVIGLYTLFLRDFSLGIIRSTGMNPLFINEFTDRMMLAGLLVVINTTTCFGIVQICVNDSALGIKKDYMAAPVSAFQLISGYWASSMAVSWVFTCLTVLGGEIFFKANYGCTVQALSLFKTMAVILFSSCINSAILLCFAKDLRNTATFCTFGNLYGTLIGFFAGAYLPYYFYPGWLKQILFFFPPAQVTSVMRQIYVNDMCPVLMKGQHPKFLTSIFQNFGITVERHGEILNMSQQFSFLVLALAVLMIYLWLCNVKGHKHH